jgi:hypothetical protein
MQVYRRLCWDKRIPGTSPCCLLACMTPWFSQYKAGLQESTYMLRQQNTRHQSLLPSCLHDTMFQPVWSRSAGKYMLRQQYTRHQSLLSSCLRDTRGSASVADPGCFSRILIFTHFVVIPFFEVKTSQNCIFLKCLRKNFGPAFKEL